MISQLCLQSRRIKFYQISLCLSQIYSQIPRWGLFHNLGSLLRKCKTSKTYLDKEPLNIRKESYSWHWTYSQSCHLTLSLWCLEHLPRCCQILHLLLHQHLVLVIHFYCLQSKSSRQILASYLDLLCLKSDLQLCASLDFCCEPQSGRKCWPE